MSRFQVLSDAQWSLIEGMLPRPTGRKGRPFADARLMVEGIVYRYRAGIAWRDLPEVVRTVADGVDLASPDGIGRDLGHCAREAHRRRGR